jgi:hypothetical protein
VAASLIMLPLAVVVRLTSPSPFAPRVHVRWATGVSDAQRAELERRYSLVQGRHRDAETWEYDLVDVAPSSVRALIADPAVADTHYLDRDRGAVQADAPAGTVPLAERRLAGWIHSPVFEWFTLFWVSSLIVSGVWLASAPGVARR